MEDKKALETRLEELERRIRETEDRLPAHSVKPTIMQELLELEDERDTILARLESLRSQGK
jgi:hypothetical protein